LNFKCRSFSEFSFKIHFEFEEVSMEKVVPFFKPNKPYFISVFPSEESPFWISQNLKEFKFHLNLFEFDFFNPIVTASGTVAWGPFVSYPGPPLFGRQRAATDSGLLPTAYCHLSPTPTPCRRVAPLTACPPPLPPPTVSL
jgi:hypothetical protein